MVKWPLIFLAVLAVVITVVFFRPKAQSDERGTVVLPLMSASQTSISFSPVFDQEIEFTSQAPFAVWDNLHNESCEEASLLIAQAWAYNLTLNPSFADAELKKVADWETSKFGYFESTTAKQTAQLAREFYGLKVDLIKNPSQEEIKKELIDGNLVVMGMAGRLLGNPHFKAPGPVYHMLVIKGYDEQGFFTNDPGTLYGKNYYYTYDTIMKAAHDWTGADEEIYTSPAVALIIHK